MYPRGEFCIELQRWLSLDPRSLSGMVSDSRGITEIVWFTGPNDTVLYDKLFAEQLKKINKIVNHLILAQVTYQ